MWFIIATNIHLQLPTELFGAYQSEQEAMLVREEFVECDREQGVRCMIYTILQTVPE